MVVTVSGEIQSRLIPDSYKNIIMHSRKRLGVVLLKILGHSAFVVISISGASFKQILHRE